jgi:hypothetical protein
VKYKLSSYIPEDDILHSHGCENLKSYIALTGWALYRRHNVSPVRYELGLYIPEDYILHSYHRENLKSHIINFVGIIVGRKFHLYYIFSGIKILILSVSALLYHLWFNSFQLLKPLDAKC